MKPAVFLIAGCLAWFAPLAAADRATALEEARNALTVAEAEADARPLEYAQALEHLARELGREGRTQAEPLLRRALALRESAQGDTHSEVAEALVRLARNLGAQRRYADADPLLQRAVAIQEARLGPDDPELARTLFELGSVRYFDRRHAEAIEPLSRAVTIQAQDEWAREVHLQDTLDRLAKAHAVLGNHAAVAELLEPWVADLPDDLVESISITGVLDTLGRAYRELGRADDADALFERRLSIYQSSLGPRDDIVLGELRAEAVQAILDDRSGRAESLYRRALALLDARDRVDSLERARLLRSIGRSIPVEARGDEAEAMLVQALAMARDIPVLPDSDLAEFLTALARIRGERGDHDAAIALQEEALVLLKNDPGILPRMLAAAEEDLERLRYQRRAARLGPQPLPERFAREGIVYNSHAHLPERFDMEVTRLDRAHALHEARRVAYWDLGEHARNAGASTLLVHNAGADDLCIAVLALSPALHVFVDRDGEVEGFHLNFTEPDTVAQLWQTCRIALGPDPD